MAIMSVVGVRVEMGGQDTTTGEGQERDGVVSRVNWLTNDPPP